MKAHLLIPLLLACASASASAAIYLNDAVIVDYPPFGPSLNLTQSPNGFLLVEVNKISNAYEFEFIYRAIAGNYGLFSVTSGEELTYLNASAKPTLGGFGAGNTLTLGSGQSTYIGYWSQRSGKPPSPTMEADDIFGWAKVSVVAPSGPNSAQLTVLESVSADGGIIVGTTQQIPETNSMLLAVAGTVALLRRRRPNGQTEDSSRS